MVVGIHASHWELLVVPFEHCSKSLSKKCIHDSKTMGIIIVVAIHASMYSLAPQKCTSWFLRSQQISNFAKSI